MHVYLHGCFYLEFLFFAADLHGLPLIFLKTKNELFLVFNPICVYLRLYYSYPVCFKIITYLDVTPSILFFCIAETTTALKRCADMGAWMM